MIGKTNASSPSVVIDPYINESTMESLTELTVVDQEEVEHDITIAYDEGGNASTITYDSDQISVLYDSNGILTKVGNTTIEGTEEYPETSSAAIKSATLNQNNSFTIVDVDDLSHTMTPTYTNNKVTSISYDGTAMPVTYDSDGNLTKVGSVDVGGFAGGYSLKSYLQSTGSQYIDTGYYANENTCISAKFLIDEFTSDHYDALYGDFVETEYYYAYDTANKFLYTFGGNQLTPSSNVATNTIYDLVVNTNTLTVYNGSSVVDTATVTQLSEFTSNRTMLMFASRKYNNTSIVNTDTIIHGRIYGFTISENDAVIKNFVPCVRNSDGVAGMYETVEGEFYANQGSGSFGYGSQIGVDQNGFALGLAAKGKITETVTVPYPINVTFQVPNGTDPETYTEHTKVGIKPNGKIAEPTTPSIPSGYNFFNGWYDGQTKVSFPYAPISDKTLNAQFLAYRMIPSKITNFIVPNTDLYRSDGGTVNFNPFSQTSGFEIKTEGNEQFYRLLQGYNILSYNHDLQLAYGESNYGFSLGGWFRIPSDTLTSWQDMICLGYDGLGYIVGIDIYATGSSLIVLGVSSTYKHEITNLNIGDTWFHFVITVNNEGNASYYFNGELISVSTDLTAYISSEAPLKLGTAPWGGNIKNYLDVTQFFSSPHVLTEAEVQTLHSYFN